MKIIRYTDKSGTIKHAALQPGGEAMELLGDPIAGVKPANRPAEVVKLLAPVVPAIFCCIGLNYRHHAAETGAKIPEYPILFTKPPGAVQNPGDPILIPTHLASSEVDYECELAVVIGRGPDGSPCKNVSRADALQYVAGYTCANDVSARDWQIKRGGGQWSRGKSFDTFGPLGPCLATSDSIPNPNALKIRTILNGRVMQDSSTADMIFDVPTLIEFLSGSSTLVPGTVILTGTPQGVGMARKPPVYLKPGDSVSIEIESIGTLTNSVELEK